MKVGDRVKVIKDHVFPENIGLVGNIYNIYNDSIWILFDNLKVKPLPYTITELELVPELDIRLNLLADINS